MADKKKQMKMQVKMKMHKPTREEIEKAYTFLNEAEEVLDMSYDDYFENWNWNDFDFKIFSDFDTSSEEEFLISLLNYLKHSRFKMLLFALEVCLDNTANPKSKTLEFKPGLIILPDEIIQEAREVNEDTAKEFGLKMSKMIADVEDKKSK